MKRRDLLKLFSMLPFYKSINQTDNIIGKRVKITAICCFDNFNINDKGTITKLSSLDETNMPKINNRQILVDTEYGLLEIDKVEIGDGIVTTNGIQPKLLNSWPKNTKIRMIHHIDYVNPHDMIIYDLSKYIDTMPKSQNAIGVVLDRDKNNIGNNTRWFYEHELLIIS